MSCLITYQDYDIAQKLRISAIMIFKRLKHLGSQVYGVNIEFKHTFLVDREKQLVTNMLNKIHNTKGKCLMFRFL